MFNDDDSTIDDGKDHHRDLSMIRLIANFKFLVTEGQTETE